MQTDVMIVGAGPVGLMLGCELARRGVSHTILEAKPKREEYCKALGVSPRTLEVFDQLGVLDDALERGFHFAGLTVTVDDVVVREVAAQHDGLPYGAFAMSQPHSEEILENYWTRFGHKIQREETLTALEQSPDCVVATLASGERLEAKYLVGCDGAHSTVRKALSTSFEGDRFGLTFLLGDVHLQWDRPHNQNWQFIRTENGELRNILTVIANPTAPGRYRLSAAVEDGFEAPDHPPMEMLQEVLGALLPAGTVMSELRWSSRYNISHRVAGAYRTGRVFLAGDAAHIHPPIGGLGMNTGLQDAHNLGWKLAGVCRGFLSESVLDSYHSERHDVGQRVVEVTAGRMNRAMGQVDDTPDPEGFDTQLNIRYPSGLLVAAATVDPSLPGPGHRLPSVEGLRRAHTWGEVRSAEFFRDGRFSLFLQGDLDVDGFSRVGASALGGQVRTWVVRGPEAHDTGTLSLLTDSLDLWATTIGPGATFVRPDGMIGWQGDDPAALRAWLAGFCA